MDKQKLNEIATFATEIRIETIKELGARGFGHIGGALSVADTLAVLYSGVMNVDPKNPEWDERDMLVMSKGHAGPSLYATLAMKGFFPMDWLKTLNQPGTRLPSHCDRKLTPGVDMTTGSLGQGASTAIGLALAKKLDEKPGYVYLFLGDGESNEGQVWEAAQFAPHHGLDNLIVFTDYNKKQLDGDTDEILCQRDYVAKYEAFGWHALAIDGHDFEQIDDAIDEAKAVKNKPSCIVLNTTKGMGAKIVSDVKLNHHLTVDEAMMQGALEELGEKLASLKGGAWA